MGNPAKQCRLGLFQDSDFAGDLEDSKSSSGGTLCIFGSHTFVPISWMCKKQTSVSHSSTESEIISSGAGLRLDGIPAFDLWDLIVAVLGNVSRVSDGSGKPDNDVYKRHKSQTKIDVMKDIDSVLSNVQSARQEALLYVFEDNEAVIKMIIKGRSPTMRHVSRTHRVALDCLFDRINLDSKIQIKYIDTKNQLADILTKENFTRDEWNHLLSLFNISHFSSTACTAAMAKRIQQDSGKERVTAKSIPMMNLTARMPSVVSSSTSSSPGKRWYGNQDPWKSVVVDDRSGQPERPSPPGYSKEDYDGAWSSQEWKSEATAPDRSGKPDKTSWNAVQQIRPHHGDALLDRAAQSVRYGGRLHDGSGQPESANSQEVADSENFVMGNDAAEFVNKVKDQVRKRQKRMSNVADSGEEHSIIWGMFMAATMNAATFMGKNFMDYQNFIMNSTNLTLKKMFDITVKLVGEQEEINNVDKIHWEEHSWKHLSLIGEETVSIFNAQKVYVFSDSVLCLGKVHQHPESNKAGKERTGWIVTDKSYRDYDGINAHPDSNEAWKNRIAGVMSEKSYKDYDGINGEPTEFEWNIFPRFTTLQLCGTVTDLLIRRNTRNFHKKNSIYVDVQRHFL